MNLRDIKQLTAEELLTQIIELSKTVDSQREQFRALAKNVNNPEFAEYFEEFTVTDRDGEYVTSRAKDITTMYRLNRASLQNSKEKLLSMIGFK